MHNFIQRKIVSTLILSTALFAGVIPSSSFASFKGQLGEKATHDKSIQELVNTAPTLASYFAKTFAVIGVVVGVALFIFSIMKLREKDRAGEAVLGMTVGAMLCIALVVLSVFVGVTWGLTSRGEP